MTFLRSHVVGSMLRPDELKSALPLYREGKVSREQLRSIEDRAVDEAIRTQEEAGIDLITDGEQRRLAFADVMSESMGLMRAGGQRAREAVGGMWRGPEKALDLEINNPVGGIIAAKLKRGESQTATEFAYAKRRAKNPVKVTLPSPTMFLAAWAPGVSEKAYPHFGAAISDIVDILKAEVHALAQLGCTHIQFDAPELTFAIDVQKSPVLRATGMSQEAFCATVTEGLAAVAVEPGVTFSLHICRGNARGLWHSAGGYGAIAPLVFPRLKPFAYVLLEYDTDRAGGFEPLSALPAETCAVLGLVTTKAAALEDRATLSSRVRDAERYRSLDALAISPQCGFASDICGNPLNNAAQASKLELVGAVAREIWG